MQIDIPFRNRVPQLHEQQLALKIKEVAQSKCRSYSDNLSQENTPKKQQVRHFYTKDRPSFNSPGQRTPRTSLNTRVNVHFVLDIISVSCTSDYIFYDYF